MRQQGFPLATVPSGAPESVLGKARIASKFHCTSAKSCLCHHLLALDFAQEVERRACCNMKFSRELSAANSGAPKVFRDSFLNYASLKKFLKFRSMQLKQLSAESRAAAEAARRADAEFLGMLASQLREIDRHACD